jgi:hypothetical protein
VRKLFANLLISSLLASLSVVGITSAVQPAAATAGFRSTLGQEFWVTFDSNNNNQGTPTIYLSGAQNANVTITWPDATTESATVVAGTVTTVDATAKIRTAAKYTTGNDAISQTAIKIVADASISVYVLNQVPFTTDASQAYPTEYQGYEYRVLNSNLGAGRFSVIANEPGSTVVTVTPKTTIGSRTAGVAYTQTLQQGDVYSIQGNDIRGTLVTSDKKITVTSSNNCVNLGGGACDHITEFIPPVTTWGKSFIVPATTNTLQQDRLAIMASADNTVVTINGVATTLALAGDLYDQLISAVGATTVVSSDKPVLVMQFVRGGRYTNGTITRTGDPAMVVMTPVVQYLNDVAITTPATGFDVNTATLVVPVSDVGTITFNGTAIPAGDFGPTITIGSSDFKVTYVNLALGAHRITSTNGFGIYVYGYNAADSYAYAGAGGLVDLVQFPGGVAQVGYVAANQIGTPQQQQQQAPPPAQVVAPPAPAIFFNRSIQVGTTGTIRLSGVNLTGLTSLKIGDKTVEIVSSGDGFAEIKLPELAAGVYNFSTTGTRTEGAWIGTQQLVLTVVAAAANPNPGGLKSATFTITNFVGGSAVLTAAMKARIAAEVAKHGGVKSSACVGATSGPTILSVDASLAQRRAVAVCNYIATLTPRVITTTSGKNTLLPGGSARKVTVTLRF